MHKYLDFKKHKPTFHQLLLIWASYLGFTFTTKRFFDVSTFFYRDSRMNRWRVEHQEEPHHWPYQAERSYIFNINYIIYYENDRHQWYLDIVQMCSNHFTNYLIFLRVGIGSSYIIASGDGGSICKVDRMEGLKGRQIRTHDVIIWSKLPWLTLSG